MRGFYLFTFCFLFKPCTADYWTQKADLPSARAEAVGFSIGNYGYITTGADSIFPNGMLQFDPSSNSWSMKASIPQSRTGAVGISCLGKGYVGLGYSSGFLNDWWEYDPVLNVWTQKNNFPGAAREYASAFSIDSNIYVGCGLHQTNARDWWTYNVAFNSWSPIDSIPSMNQYGYRSGTSFSIGLKGYFIGGTPGGKHVYEYDPSSGVWITKNLFTGFGRFGATGFSIGARGYVGTGDTNFSVPFLKDFWQYDNIADLWIQKGDFAGQARATAIGFSIGAKGYLGTGYENGLFWLKDFWEYTPDSAVSTAANLNQHSEIFLYPIPARDKLAIHIMHQAIIQIDIFSLMGEKIANWQFSNNNAEFEIDTSELIPGIYILQATSGEKTWRTKVMKE